MAHQDCRGLDLGTPSDEAARQFDATISAYLRFARNTGGALKACLTADPEFPMAHCLKGYCFQMFSVPGLERKAHQALAQAREGAAGRSISSREAAHLDALDCWLTCDL